MVPMHSANKYLIVASCLMVAALCLATAEAQTTAGSRSGSTLGSSNDLVVNTTSGLVQGFNQDNLARAFLGIPFAEPPQRFAAAQPRAWSGVLNATRFPPPCIQTATLGVEDCLYLNVFTPLNAGSGSSPNRLPVMVWIHGGRYWTGQSDQYVGKYLAGNGQVVLVTIQYRLNTFGFFALPELIAQNNVNVGFLDQILAVEWVRNNIANFGGDANNIALFGESAGANSAMLHTMVHKYTNPSSLLNYAQTVILQSTWQWNLPTMNQTVAASIKWAASLGCNQTATADVLACMRSLPATRVVTTPSNGVINYFQPAVDGVFLTDQPLNLIKRGEYDTDVNVVIGFNEDEGHFMAYTRNGFRGPSANLTASDFNRSVNTNSLSFFLTQDQVNQVLGWYSANTAAKGFWYGASDILGDYYVICGSLLATPYLANNSPTYAYVWNYTSANYPDQFLEAAHGNELPYIFNGTVYTSYTFNAIDLALASRMLTSWARIANKGRPDTDQWPRWQNSSQVAFLWEQTDANPSPPTRTVPFSVSSRQFCAAWEPFFTTNSMVQP